MTIKRYHIFLLDKEKGKPDAKLRFRVRWGQNIVAFNLGFRIDISKWSTEAQRCKNNTTHGKKKIHSSIINKEIQRFEQLVDDTFMFFESKDIYPTKDEFKSEFNRLDGKIINKEKTIFDCYDEFMNEQGRKNRWTEATYKKHKTNKRHLLNFSSILNFTDLTEKGLTKYVDYLLSIQIDKDNRGLRNTTIKKNISMLKWFLKWATEKGYNKEMAFSSFSPRLKTTEKKIIFLDWDELMKVYNFQIPKGKNYLSKVRDVFCFCCFTSLRYSDVANLKKSDIFTNHIITTTIKTADTIKIELNKYSKTILDKYSNENFKGNLALPVISNPKMNLFLKELGELCEINTPITITYYKGGERIDKVFPKYKLLGTHSGRRTFICNALMLGIAPQVVMKWTGHSNYSAMKPYIDIADKAKQEAMNLFNK